MYFSLYNTVLVLPYINMNPPRVCISSHVQNRLFDSVGEGEGGMIWDDGIETQHSFKLSIVWMFGSLFPLFYYSVLFSTFITSFSTFHILEGRGQIFKEDFRGFERCPAGFWFGLVFALVFRFYNLVLNIIYLNSNIFEPN